MRRFALHTLLPSFTASLALVLAACGGSSTHVSHSSDTTTARAADDPSCPMTVPGTSVTVEDTDAGAALVFVTTGDVAQLRERVRAMATMHNDMHGAMGPLPTGDESGGAGHSMHSGHGMDMGAGGGDQHAGMDHGDGATAGGEHAAMNHGDHAKHAGGMISVHSRAEAGDVEGGARLAFVAAPADVAALQSGLRAHAEHLSSGSCAMDGH